MNKNTERILGALIVSSLIVSSTIVSNVIESTVIVSAAMVSTTIASTVIVSVAIVLNDWKKLSNVLFRDYARKSKHELELCPLNRYGNDPPSLKVDNRYGSDPPSNDGTDNGDPPGILTIKDYISGMLVGLIVKSSYMYGYLPLVFSDHPRLTCLNFGEINNANKYRRICSSSSCSIQHRNCKNSIKGVNE